MVKSISKVKLGHIFTYKSEDYRRMGRGLRAINMFTGELKLFIGTEMVDVHENSL